MNTINRAQARRVAIVPVSYELLLHLLASVLPPDAKLAGVHNDPFAGAVEFLLESESYPKVSEGTTVPLIPLEIA